MNMKQRSFRVKNLTMRGSMNDDDSSCCSMPSQHSDDSTAVSSFSSSSLVSSSSSSSLSLSLTKQEGVSFDSKVQVRSAVAYNDEDEDEDEDEEKWYSQEELKEIKKAVVATIREMRKPEKKKQRGLCSRGLENVKSAEHNQARLQRRNQVMRAVLETAGEEQRALSAQKASQICRHVALDLASKDEAFVQSSSKLDEIMETVRREHQAYRDGRTILRSTQAQWQSKSTLTTPVWEQLQKVENETESPSSSPIMTSFIPSKAKRWVSSAMRSPSWRQKQQVNVVKA